MTANCGQFPALGRYFKTLDELARAGCMCRQKMTDCLRGRKEFTDNEKMAICNAIIAKMVAKEIDNFDILDILNARSGRFDETFRTRRLAA